MSGNLIYFLDISSKTGAPITSSVNNEISEIKELSSIIKKTSSINSNNNSKKNKPIFEKNIFLLNYNSNSRFVIKYITYLIENYEDCISWNDNIYKLNNNTFNVSELTKIKDYNSWNVKNIIKSTDTNYIVSCHQKIPYNNLYMYIYFKLLQKIDIYNCIFPKANISFIYKNNEDNSYGENTYIKLDFITNGIFDFINICKNDTDINNIINKLNKSTGQKYDYLKKPYKNLLNCINTIINTTEVYTHNLKNSSNTYIFTTSGNTKINNDIYTCDRSKYVILYKDFVNLLKVITDNFYNLVIYSLLPSNSELTFITEIIKNHNYLYNEHLVDNKSLDYYLVNLTKEKYINGFTTVTNLINDKLKKYTDKNNVKYYNNAVKIFIKALKYIIDVQLLYDDYKLKININSLDCIITNDDGNTFYINNINTNIDYSYTYDAVNVFELKPNNNTYIDLLYSLIISCPLIKYYENKESLYHNDTDNPNKNCKIYYTDINNKALNEIVEALNYYLLLKNNNLNLNDVFCPTLYKNNNLELLSNWLHNCLELINTSFFVVKDSISKYKTIYDNNVKLLQFNRLDVLENDKLYNFNITEPNLLTQTKLDYSKIINETLNEKIIQYIKTYSAHSISKELENEFLNWDTGANVDINELNKSYNPAKETDYNNIINKIFRVSNKCISQVFCGNGKPFEGINNKLTINLSSNNTKPIKWTSNQIKSLQSSIIIGSGRISNIENYNYMLGNLKFLIDYFGITTYILINENSPQLACDIFNAYNVNNTLNIIPICTTDFEVTTKQSLLKMFKAVFYHKKVKKGKIWIHCGFGAGRTGRVVINYLIYEFFKDINTIKKTDPYYNYKKLAYENFKNVVNNVIVSINNFNIVYSGIKINWLRKLYRENYSPEDTYAEPLTHAILLSTSLGYLNEIFDEVIQLEQCINDNVNSINDINLYKLLTLNTCDEIKKNIRDNKST